MARKTNNQTPVPEEFREQYENKYAALHLEWESLFDFAPDEVAASLVRAIIKYAKRGEAPKLDGMAGAYFQMMKETIDKDLERGLQLAYGSDLRRQRRESRKQNGENGGNIKGEGEVEIENRTKKENIKNNLPPNPSLTPAHAGVGGGETKPIDPADSVNLRDYFTEDQEGLLLNAIFYAGGLVAGVLEHFVLSPDYDPADDPDTMEAKMLDFKRRYEDDLDRKEAKARQLSEDRLRQERLANSSPAPRPRSLQELRTFCSDSGNPAFDCDSLWEEMEASDWKITDRKSGAIRPLADWHKFVLYRIAHS